jgi:hypothetical protein
MAGARKMPIYDVRIRICDDLGELSHPPHRTVEPDRVHFTAGAVGRTDRLSTLATPNARFAVNPKRALPQKSSTA